MAKAKVRVLTGCSDCKMCTGNAITGKGRSMGRGAANVGTFGIAAATRHRCKACDHPMSEHKRDIPWEQTSWAAAGVSQNPARWVKQTDRRYRWWNGEHWTDYYVTSEKPTAEQIEAAKAAVTDMPPRWKQQPDGRYRWWAGDVFTDHYTRDPVGEIEYSPAPETPGGASGVSVADEIRKLAELHAAGILDDEEFAAAKKKAVGL